ncbi:MAG TPA: hypothetical protein VHM93_20365 [Candidatus Acidoferrum sp.]|nr:hypothetical protein [Candidatus Acidoferrum sp.]
MIRSSTIGRLLPAGLSVAGLVVLGTQVSPRTGFADSFHAGHQGMDSSMPMPDGTPSYGLGSPTLQDKKESEFNHHLAGLFVILAGFFLLPEDALRQRWPAFRFAWPACFLACGLFLLIFSDTELWPFGPQSWWYGLTHNPEDLQHKAFAAVLLTLGTLEIQRVRRVVKSAWAAWAFPLLAVLGSVMLLFHEHRSGAHGLDHMVVMRHIQAEHLNFAIAGGGIGVVKGLSELHTRWKPFFTKSWPLLLGVFLMRYTE